MPVQKSVQEIFYGLQGLQRTSDTGTFRFTDELMQFRFESPEVRDSVPTQEPPSDWELYLKRIEE